MLVFPLFGFQASLDQNFGIAMVFTVVSLVRSYALRRLFELLQRSRDSLFPFGEAPSYSHGAESAGNSADGRQP